jgi:hypothetical protein
MQSPLTQEDLLMKTKVTMLELVTTVGEFARSEAEVIATVAHMVNSGLVELCGNFRGARIVFEPVAGRRAA